MKSFLLGTKIRRFFSVKKQMKWGRYIVFCAARISRWLFDPYGQPSYSQFGEDRIIESCFVGQEHGVYVDVGCNHPVMYSNTWKLYRRGWRGVAVDPNPDLVSEFKKVRPKDIAIQKVVSNGIEPVDFYFSKTSNLVSGIGEKREGHWQRTEENSTVESCTPVRLCDLLEEHKIPSQFELLSVDVEGHELEVLDSLDFIQFSPKVIVIEMHDFDISSPANNPVYDRLTTEGYQMTAYVGPSGFFKKESVDGCNIFSM